LPDPGWLLILDDWGLVPLTAPEARDLLEVVDDRSMTRSTLVSSQLPVENWHSTMGDPTVADAILEDRASLRSGRRVHRPGDWTV